MTANESFSGASDSDREAVEDAKLIGHWQDAQTSAPIPWNTTTAPNRVRPRECVGNARDALDRAYGIRERAAVPLLIEALDWLRRALEQMAPEEADRG